AKGRDLAPGIVHALPVRNDPYDCVLSFNIHRRHLTTDQKRDLIAKVIKAKPEYSNRQIADRVWVSPTTVRKVRAEMEEAGDVSRMDTLIDALGRRQPAQKPTKVRASKVIEPEREAPCPSSPGRTETTAVEREMQGSVAMGVSAEADADPDAPRKVDLKSLAG